LRVRARDDHDSLTAEIERLVWEREERPEIPEPDEDERRMTDEHAPEPESTPRKPKKRAGKKRKG
jgi:hypothetical protein